MPCLNCTSLLFCWYYPLDLRSTKLNPFPRGTLVVRTLLASRCLWEMENDWKSALSPESSTSQCNTIAFWTSRLITLYSQAFQPFLDFYESYCDLPPDSGRKRCPAHWHQWTIWGAMPDSRGLLDGGACNTTWVGWLYYSHRPQSSYFGLQRGRSRGQ